MTADQALTRLTALCSRAEHCTYDVTEKLRRWGIMGAAQKKIIAFLQEEKYLDDARYARLAAQEKLHINRWGRQKIYMSLAQKHIDNDIIHMALDTIDDSEYIAILTPLLRAKAATLHTDNAFERYAKLLRYAQSRGFTSDIIHVCLSSMRLTDEG